MVLSHLFLILILSLTFLPPPISSNIAADRSALLRLQGAVRGRTLLWNTTAAADAPCSWEGVKCDATTNRVVSLRLPGNCLRGHLPPDSVGALTELRILSLRRNSLSGEIPSDLASCTQLHDLHLQGNNFSGEIPTSLFTLTNLVRVNLAGNNFSGHLSSRFNNLTRLKTLYLENNRFTGPLPNLQNLIMLRNFNVSFNRGLTGNIPSNLAVFTSQSFLETSLCGYPLVSCSNNNGNSLSKGAKAGIAVGSSLVLLSIILIILFFSWRKRKTRKIIPQIERSPTPISPVKPIEQEIRHPNYPIMVPNEIKINNMGIKSDGLVFFGEEVKNFSLQDLLSAYAEVMGKGTIGSTYKAYFENGIEVIVKRLKNVCVSEEVFIGKIEDVGSLLHENLGPLKGYLYGRDEKLLLYEPMTIGSLFQLLHGNDKRPLSWDIRTKIAIGVAHGIEYLHSISRGMTHGNLKSSNIFISDNYNARVSEFGLTHLVSPLGNLNGYRAPEVTDTRDISQEADVYSFGVLLLEILTGKEPDKVLTEEGVELPNWVRLVDQDKWSVEVIDSDLVRFEKFEERMMVEVLKLAMSCTDQLPDRRPSMEEVARRIEEICG